MRQTPHLPGRRPGHETADAGFPQVKLRSWERAAVIRESGWRSWSGAVRGVDLGFGQP